MYSYEIDNILKKNNYIVTIDLYKEISSSSQICFIKYDTYSNKFCLSTEDGYNWIFEVINQEYKGDLIMNKEIKKITIKNFVDEYNKRIPQLQEDYIKDNLVITKYVPFVKKDALVQKLVDISTYKYEDYTKGDGTIGRRKTDKIKVNSTVQYLFFCRLVIENYTNLVVETEGFYEEYDALKECGLLDKLMVSTETRPSLIPMDEIAELRSLVSMKQSDIMTNYCEPHNYVNSLVERFGDIIDVLAKPIMDKAMKQMSEPETDNVEENNFLEVVK